jgi:hypothetical protein
MRIAGPSCPVLPVQSGHTRPLRKLDAITCTHLFVRYPEHRALLVYTHVWQRSYRSIFAATRVCSSPGAIATPGIFEWLHVYMLRYRCLQRVAA